MGEERQRGRKEEEGRKGRGIEEVRQRGKNEEEKRKKEGQECRRRKRKNEQYCKKILLKKGKWSMKIADD